MEFFGSKNKYKYFFKNFSPHHLHVAGVSRMGQWLPRGSFCYVSLQGLISLWVTIGIISRPPLLWDSPPVCMAHAIFILVHERHFRCMYPWFWYIFLPSLHSWGTVLCPSAYLWHLFKYSYGGSNWRMLPAISRIYHLSCRGIFYVPCEIPGTRDLGFKSHPQDFFGPELGRALYSPPHLQLGELQHQRVKSLADRNNAAGCWKRSRVACIEARHANHYTFLIFFYKKKIFKYDTN